jgi:hypothetical protein
MHGSFDDYVVQDAFMHNGCLRLSHSGYPVRPQCLPGCCNLTFALDPDPKHIQAHKGRPQSLLVSFAIQEHLVEDDACPVGSNSWNPEIPGGFKLSPFVADLHLAVSWNRSKDPSSIPWLGYRLDQVVDSEQQPGFRQDALQATGDC